MARFGIDIWMTTTAIADGFRVCQAFLGAKIHDAKDPGADLAAMFVQVVSSVFDLMETYHERWPAVEGAEEVPLFGFPHGVGLEPVAVNATGCSASSRRASATSARSGRGARPETLATWPRPRGVGGAASTSPTALWVRVVYDFARRLPPPRPAAGPAAAVAGARSTSAGPPRSCWRPRESGADEVEAAIRGLADEFVRQKADLLDRWG